MIGFIGHRSLQYMVHITLTENYMIQLYGMAHLVMLM